MTADREEIRRLTSGATCTRPTTASPARRPPARRRAAVPLQQYRAVAAGADASSADTSDRVGQHKSLMITNTVGRLQ